MSNQKKYIISIDQSTSASKVILFNEKAELIHRISILHRQIYPEPTFVEHDAVEIFENVRTGLRRMLVESNIEEDEIAGIAITNQRETVVIWDKKTGLPVANAAVWQCQRGADFCKELIDKDYSRIIQQKTGLIIDPYFSASKLRWFMKNINGLHEKALHGELLLGTIDSWLLYKLSGGKVHATDFSNACRTLLFNINSLEWDRELLELFSIPESMLPEVKYSDEIFGTIDPGVVFDQEHPIAGLIGDSHAAFFGHNCFEPGIGKATYGTGSSVMMNIGHSPVPPPKGLVTSIGFSRDKKIDYVFEGNIHCTGDTLNWLKNELELINDVSEAEALATSVESNRGVYLVPAFVGLGAPYWNNKARAVIVGISRDSTKAHIVRAAIESIAYQVKDLVDLMVTSNHVKIGTLRVDGGAAQNDFLMQFQADMIQGEVDRAGIEEISALGSAFLAGLATGLWSKLEEIENLRISDRTFSSKMEKEECNRLYQGWKNAVAKT